MKANCYPESGSPMFYEFPITPALDYGPLLLDSFTL